MAALLTSVLDNSDKVSAYIGECGEMGIPLLPPDINASRDRFTVEEGGIRFGLVAIKNIGWGFIQAVLTERENGPFSSLSDFCGRCPAGDKRAIENLIRAGAFDSTGARRSQLIKVYEAVLDAAISRRRENLDGQLDFFAQNQQREMVLPDIPEFSPQELLTMEKETTGLYLSGHPMDAYRETVRRLGVPSIGEILADFAEGPKRFADGQRVSLAGVITASRTRTTKSNTLMAYVTLEDDTASMELLCFARCLETSGPYLRENQAVLATGRLSVRDEKAPQLLCDSAYLLSTVGQPLPEAQANRQEDRQILYLKFPSLEDPKTRHMKKVFTMFPGQSPVKLVMADTRKRYGARLLIHPALLREARNILGEENVVLRQETAQEAVR